MITKRWARAGLALLVAGSVVGAACGGDEEEATAVPTAKSTATAKATAAATTKAATATATAKAATATATPKQ